MFRKIDHNYSCFLNGLETTSQRNTLHSQIEIRLERKTVESELNGPETTSQGNTPHSQIERKTVQSELLKASRDQFRARENKTLVTRL